MAPAGGADIALGCLRCDETDHHLSNQGRPTMFIPEWRILISFIVFLIALAVADNKIDKMEKGLEDLEQRIEDLENPN
jgi:hypothetical protein